ncbi:hypothetical protein NQ314_019366 [Rhamnusium bicolor]|uniref:Uncharacterized protein n=1 Tax=Rhamnusium bicolor TaxID=1586634 RepID=A0AAV8WPL6_9CUCU|nr:hypothetical protein NQ314_019366 [Rhamnusium bicolor]
MLRKYLHLVIISMVIVMIIQGQLQDMTIILFIITTTNNDVPKEATIEPNAIVACVGDTGSFCPANTTSLCTNNGAVMCVASAVSTVPCTKEKQTNCVKSTVPCKDNNAPECKQSTQSAASIAIPCISTAKVYGDISYVNNSIVISNSTDYNNTTITDAISIVTTTESNTNVTTTTTNSATPVNASTAANTTDSKKRTSPNVLRNDIGSAR